MDNRGASCRVPYPLVGGVTGDMCWTYREIKCGLLETNSISQEEWPNERKGNAD